MPSEVTLGIAPVKVTLGIPTLARVRALFGGEDPLSRVRVLVAQAALSIQREDEGAVDLSFWVINFSKRTVIPETLNIQQWSLLGRNLPELPTSNRGLNVRIQSRTLHIISVAVQLNTAAIRRIREATPPAPAQAVGCNWAFNVYAQLNFKHGEHPLDVQLQIPNPQVQFYWYFQG